MYKLFITITLVVTLFLTTVRCHGGHNEGLQTKNAIQDALLSYLCRGSNGFPCNGHGSCSSGVCTCKRGYSGEKCETSALDITHSGHLGDTTGFGHLGDTTGFGHLGDTSGFGHLGDTSGFGRLGDTSGFGNNVGGINLHDLISPVTEAPQLIACFPHDEKACSGHGFCHEGSCLCEDGYSGILCELSHGKGFCETYKECAECTSLMSDCPEKCSLMAKFKLVFGFPLKTEGETFRQCRFKNTALNCTYFFKEESVSPQGQKTIMVKACLSYQEATSTNETLEQKRDKLLQPVTSTQSTTSSRIDESTTRMDTNDTRHEHPHGDHKHGPMDHTHGPMDDTGSQDNQTGDSGTSFIKPETILVIGSFLILLSV